jgi:hypothetical protein
MGHHRTTVCQQVLQVTHKSQQQTRNKSSPYPILLLLHLPVSLCLSGLSANRQSV